MKLESYIHFEHTISNIFPDTIRCVHVHAKCMFHTIGYIRQMNFDDGLNFLFYEFSQQVRIIFSESLRASGNAILCVCADKVDFFIITL